MDKNKKAGKYITSVSLGTAAVWFSTHCGAGFASGTQELQYFANHGWFGPLMPIISMIVLGLTYYICFETARQTDTYNYDGWSKLAFSPYGKFFSICMELGAIIVTIAASAAAIASGANLINQELGIPVFFGSVIMFVIITLLCIFGEKIVRNNAIIMTIFIIAILSIVLITGLIKFAPNIVRLVSEGYVNPEAPKWSVTGSAGTQEGSFFNSLIWALTYTGFQFAAIGGIATSFKGATSKKEAKGAVFMGTILNILMLVGVCFLIFSGMPDVYTNKEAQLLPTIHMVNQIDLPILNTIYPILLFLALITTAVGLTFGMVERIHPHVLKNMKNLVAKKAIIAVGCLLVCYAISQLGLMFVIQTAYKYLGIFSWIFLIIPIWILGFKNIKRRDKGEL